MMRRYYTQLEELRSNLPNRDIKMIIGDFQSKEERKEVDNEFHRVKTKETMEDNAESNFELETISVFLATL